MVSKLLRKNTYAPRKPLSAERKAKQREYLAKARATKIALSKNRLKCLTNRQLTDKLESLDTQPQQDEEVIDELIEASNNLNEDVEESSNTIHGLGLEIDKINKLFSDLNERISQLEITVDYHDVMLESGD